LRKGIDDFFACSPKKTGGYCRRSNPNEQDVVEPDSVKAMRKRQDTLDFVRLHGGSKNLP